MRDRLSTLLFGKYIKKSNGLKKIINRQNNFFFNFCCFSLKVGFGKYKTHVDLLERFSSISIKAILTMTLANE